MNVEQASILLTIETLGPRLKAASLPRSYTPTLKCICVYKPTGMNMKYPLQVQMLSDFLPPSLVVLFWKVLEALGNRPLPEEMGS